MVAGGGKSAEGSRRSRDKSAQWPRIQSWQNQAVMPGWSPPALEGHSAHVVQGKMYLFGGQSTNGPTNDLAVLDLARLRWSRATLVGPLRPAPRCFHAGWSDDSRRVWVHGG